MTWLANILKALLEGALSFLGQRMDKKQADNAQREAGAREAEAKQHDRFAQQAREAMDVRARPPGSDADLDDGMRAPGDRGQKRPD